LGRIVLAFRCFFGILFHGALPEDAITTLGLTRPEAAAPQPKPPAADHVDGAIQILGVLQRDARLVDFLMEDITAYEDEQVGAAVRAFHDQCRDALNRYVALAPLIDGVEGTFTNLTGVASASNPLAVKFVGNVPPGVPKGGVLRHKGWRAEKITLPAPPHGSVVVAPAEIEIE
jgi:hypothetical protein